MEVAQTKEQCKSVVEYAPEIPVKMTYPIIQIEGLPVRVFACHPYGHGQPEMRWGTRILRVAITEYGGDGKSIPGELDVGGFTPDTYYSTKKDEKVVFIHAVEGITAPAYAIGGQRTSDLKTHTYLIITNYGFIHEGSILAESLQRECPIRLGCPGIFVGINYVGSRKDSVGEHSPGVYTWHRDYRDCNSQPYHSSGKLIPNPFPDYPKVPKLFIDILSSVLDKNQKRFHELCGEYKEEKEMFFEENTKLKEHNEKLQQENALLAKRCEELTERLKEYTVY